MDARRMAIARLRTSGLEWLTLLMLDLFALGYLVVARARVTYPFDLDFLEDDILIEAWRFAQGLPVFLPPNADFVPHAYAPLYMLLSAGLFKVGGVSFLAMRLLSWLATITTAVMLWWAGYAMSRRHTIALLGPGLFFAGYKLTGAQYELARVDSLMLMLVVAGTLLGVVGAGSRWVVGLSALCFALAFFTKQTALVFGLGMAGYLLVIHRKQAWIYLLLLTTMVSLPLLGMDRLTNRWSTIYLFEIPESDPILVSRIVSYFRYDLLMSLGPLCLVAIISAILIGRGSVICYPLARAWPFFTLVALVDSGWMRSRLGGNLNSLMPAYTFLCLMPVIALHKLFIVGQVKNSLWPILRDFVYLAVIGQCIIGVYNPIADIPSVAMLQSGHQLIQRIAQIPGPVLVLEHPYYALLAGKSPGVALTALWHARAHGVEPLPGDLVQRIHNEFYSAIIADEGTYTEVEADLDAEISRTYTLTDTLSEEDAPPTLNGVVVRPAWVYSPKPKLAQEDSPTKQKGVPNQSGTPRNKQ